MVEAALIDRLGKARMVVQLVPVCKVGMMHALMTYSVHVNILAVALSRMAVLL